MQRVGNEVDGACYYGEKKGWEVQYPRYFPARGRI